MVIKVYVSRTSGNLMMKKQQEHIKRLLEAKQIEYEEVDLADPHHKQEKERMKESMRLTDAEVNVLPPQIFKDGDYKGDFEQFFCAVEQDELFSCLDVACPEGEVEFLRQQEKQRATNVIACHKPT